MHWLVAIPYLPSPVLVRFAHGNYGMKHWICLMFYSESYLLLVAYQSEGHGMWLIETFVRKLYRKSKVFCNETMKKLFLRKGYTIRKN